MTARNDPSAGPAEPPNLKKKNAAAVTPDLLAVEAALRDNLGAHLELVAEVAGHLLFSGGKRLRPLLMILSARTNGRDIAGDVYYSTIFEYLHAATLLHDDLVDGAVLRRGREAAYRKYGNETAVLTGDFLLARSLSIAADTGNPEIIRVIARITEEMSQGEIHQLSRKGALELDEAEYREIIRRKTAVLIEGACRTGALLAGAGSERADALTRYGLHLGMAFQMADDLLDYTADTATLGKTVGADLREGKLTLPVILALSTASGPDRDFIHHLLSDPEFSGDDFTRLLTILRGTGALDHTRCQAGDHVTEARRCLAIFPDGPARETLLALADYAISRNV